MMATGIGLTLVILSLVAGVCEGTQMTKLTVGSFVTAVVVSLITWAAWEPFYGFSPVVNLAMVLFDVVSWGTFVLSAIKGIKNSLWAG
jgi:hypothetical protein